MIFRRGKYLAVVFAVLMMVGQSFAQNKNIDPSISVQCKDQKIRDDAIQFFQHHITSKTSKKELSSLIKRLYFQWPIKNITVEKNGNMYEFKVEVNYSITEYSLSGNRFLDKEEIIRELRDEQALYSGDDLSQALLERAKKYYAYRGFQHAQIELESIPLRESGTIRVMIKIKEGKPCLLDEISFSGNVDEYWVKKVKRQFQWKKKMNCDQEKIQTVIQELKSDYEKDHYYQFDLRNPQLEFLDDEKTKANFNAELVVGPKIFIEFRGNRYAFERDELLKKSIYLDQEKRFNQGFENTANTGIRDFYASRGYPYATSRFREKTERGVKRLIFDIDRGDGIRLKEVNIEGNEEIKTNKLKRQFWLLAPIWTKKRMWVPTEIPVIINGLMAYYQSMGYLHAYFHDPIVQIKKDRHIANLTLKLHEGKQSFFGDFKVENNQNVKTNEIMNFFEVKEGDPIDPIVLRESAQRLEYEYQTKGYKYARVKLPEVETLEEGSNDYVVRIDEGPQVTIGDIIIQGNFTTHNYVITRELAFKTGDLLNPEKIRDTRRRLLRLGFFLSISIVEKIRDDLKNVEDIVITVTERKKRTVVLKPGVSTDDGARLGGSFGFVNIAGTGRSATVSGRINHRFDSDAILEHRLVTTYLEPRIFNFFDGKVNFIQERLSEQQFDIARTSFIVGVEKTFATWLRTSVQWELEFRNPFNEDPNVVLSPLDQTRARFGSLGTYVDFDLRDNILNASKGSYHRIQFDYFNRFLLSDADFYRVYLRDSFYIPIYRRIRSVLSLRTGFAATSGQTREDNITEIPIEKRFRLGGNSTLRGFGKNCVGGLPSNAAENCSDALTSQAPGGNALFNYLFDFLLPVTDTMDLVLFTDGGNAFLNNNDFDLLDIRTTAGFGLRYNTLVGPLRIDYGIKLDRRTGESFGEFHFAVGQF